MNPAHPTPRAKARPGVRPLVLALALAGLGAVPAWAEDQADAAGSAAAEAAAKDRHALETVVVTAQKRKEDIKEVPMSVTAISGDDLNNNQVKDANDLTRNIPNVSFSAQGGAGPGLGNLEIRGVSSAAGSATVGVYMDDVSLTTRNLYSQGTAEPRFFDLERVEVLRGPQGTLYGAGSMGGTLRFISRQPDTRRQTADVAADLSTTDHGGSNYKLEAVLNQPISKDVAAVRLGVQTGHDSGYIDQIDPATLQTVSKGINGVDWSTIKLAFKLNLGGWSFTPSLFYQRTHTADIDATYTSTGQYQLNPNTQLGLFQTSKTVREPGEDVLAIPALTVNGDLGFADFTGVLNAYDRHFVRTQDGTFVNSTYVATQVIPANSPLATIVNYLPSAVYLDNRIVQTALEMRLASKLPDVTHVPFSWVAGVYANQEKTDVADSEPIFGINQAFTNAGLDINDPLNLAGSFPGAFANDSSYFSNRHYVDRQQSVFGDVTWYPSEHLRLSAGLRWLQGSQDFTREGGNYFAGTAFTSTAVDTSASKATPRFAIDWDMDTQTTLYATVAEGFRLGGANRPIPTNVSGVLTDLQNLSLSSAPSTFKPDSLWSYEIGSKSRFLDNRVNLNLAAFYIDWSNIQQDVYLPTAGFDFETNVGRANSSGLELELKARATDDLTVMLNAGVVRAVFSEDVAGLGFSNGVQNVRKGDRIEGVPDFNMALGGEYRFELAEHDSVIRLNVQTVGSSHGTVVRSDPDYNRSGYTTMDASWNVLFGAWDLALKVKNLTNDHTILQRPNVQSVSEAYYLRPRTIGLSLTGSF